MKPALIIRYCLFGLIALGLVYLGLKLPSMDVGSQFVLTVVGGTVIAIVAVKYFVPRFGDWVGTFFYSAGEVIVPDDTMKAAAKVAQGDYEGAIAEYEKMLSENPDNTLAIQEIAKIRAQKLGEPEKALLFLQQQLENRDWTEDGAAFLMFRIAELYQETLHDYAAAESVLQQVIADLPNTRHSANAHHKIHEVQEAQFKAMSAHRPKIAEPS